MGIFAVLGGASGNELLISVGVILFGIFGALYNHFHIDGRPRHVVGVLVLTIGGVVAYWVIKLHHWGQAVGIGLGIALAVVFVLAWGFFKLIGSPAEE